MPRTIPVGVPGVGANWAPSAGCTLEPAKPAGFAPQKIQVSGGARAYSVYAPKGYDGRRALPLVFVLHGDGGDGNNIRKRFALEAAAKEGAIFVYPDGLGATWKQAEPDDTGADYAFFDELSRFVLGNYCVDPTHLFVAGFSSGAYMAHQLGCFRGGVVRAVAAVGGGGPYDAAGKHYDAQGELQCRANGAVSAMVVTGLNDNIVKPSEGQKSVEHWRKNLHCDATGTKSEQCVEYTHCLPNQRLRKCDMPGLGHDIAASTPAAVWSFFASFN